MKGSAFLVVGGLVVVGAVENTTTTSPVVVDLDSTKKEVISSMKVTRKEAAQAIEGSLNTIFNEAEEDLVTENTETLNKISSDLEDLLK